MHPDIINWLNDVQPLVREFVHALQRAKGNDGFGAQMTPRDVNRILADAKKKHFLP